MHREATVRVSEAETETGVRMAERRGDNGEFGTRTRPSGLVVVERPRRSGDSEAVEKVVSGAVRDALEAFLRAAVYELGEHARRGGTAYGAAVVLRRVGREHGVAYADRIPLPRPTRLEAESARWEAWSRGRDEAQAGA
jgi:hypothetical protein